MFKIAVKAAFAAALALIAAASAAEATVVGFTSNQGYSSAFDNATNNFKFNYNTQGSDAFWLVVGGTDPNKNVVLFGDLDTGRLNAYSYNGMYVNWTPNQANHIATYDNAITVNGGVASFNIDATVINTKPAWTSGSQWQGLSYDAGSVFTWFHPTVASNFSYDAQGRVINYNYSRWILGDQTQSASVLGGSLTGGQLQNGAIPAPVRPIDGVVIPTPIPAGGGAPIIEPRPIPAGGGAVPAPAGLLFLGLALLIALGRRERQSGAAITA